MRLRKPSQIKLAESHESLNDERQQVQGIYDETIDLLIKHIEKRGEDPANHASSFAYETLLYLLISDHQGSTKQKENCLNILIKYPRFLGHVAQQVS